MFSLIRWNVFPRQVVCFLSERALFFEGKSNVFPAFGLWNSVFRLFASSKDGILPCFSSRIFVRILLSSCRWASKPFLTPFFSIGFTFGPKQAILGRLGWQSVTIWQNATTQIICVMALPFSFFLPAQHDLLLPFLMQMSPFSWSLNLYYIPVKQIFSIFSCPAHLYPCFVSSSRVSSLILKLSARG